jgi:hypothetical protein
MICLTVRYPARLESSPCPASWIIGTAMDPGCCSLKKIVIPVEGDVKPGHVFHGGKQFSDLHSGQVTVRLAARNNKTARHVFGGVEPSYLHAAIRKLTGAALHDRGAAQ